MEKLPVIYVDHGSPMRILSDNPINEELSKIWNIYNNDVTAILIISAHWVTQWTHITSSEKLETIYDFYGFPDELYEMHYDTVWNPKLAKELSHTFWFITDEKRGIDHGAWTILKQMFPSGWIPTIALSLDYKNSEEQHFEVGKKLSYLREEGVLIIASGSIVHNLSFLDFNESVSYRWAEDFNKSIQESILKNDFETVIQYKKHFPDFQKNVPTFEHFAPLFYALWAAWEKSSANYFSQGIMNGAISNNGIIFS